MKGAKSHEEWHERSAQIWIFTTVGLTVTAVKDPSGGWALEAGALVLADGGICCIDEFGCINESDKGSIHEAMEQQTLSVAKAGLVCTLNTRCTVFAVLNPKGTYDRDQDLVVNTAIASPLLSRFDIILLMLDTQASGWDESVTSYIMNNLDPAEGEEGQKVVLPNVEDDAEYDGWSPRHAFNRDTNHEKYNQTNEPTEAAKQDDGNLERWNLEEMRSYIAFVKKHFRPTLSPSARKILTRYYQQQRRSDTRHAARTTIRLLESLIRLAQAHARLMFRDIVLPQDAIMAVSIIDSSVQSSSIFSDSSAKHMECGADPDIAYETHRKQLLSSLAMRTPPEAEDSHDYASLSLRSFDGLLDNRANQSSAAGSEVSGNFRLKYNPSEASADADPSAVCDDIRSRSSPNIKPRNNAVSQFSNLANQNYPDTQNRTTITAHKSPVNPIPSKQECHGHSKSLSRSQQPPNAVVPRAEFAPKYPSHKPLQSMVASTGDLNQFEQVSSETLVSRKSSISHATGCKRTPTDIHDPWGGDGTDELDLDFDDDFVSCKRQKS